jgi:S-adenosylmethionine-diacylgycerolhomoserine-N-methlytransferase
MSALSANASVMDGIYRHQRHIYDLTRRYYLLGRNDLITALKPPRDGTVLEIGCGTARNLMLAARHYPDARLFGIDISAEMLKSAEATISKNRIGDRVRLAQGDATRFDAEPVRCCAVRPRVLLLQPLDDSRLGGRAGSGDPGRRAGRRASCG